MQCSTKTCAQLRCFENGNNDFGVEAFWIGDAARVGYFVPLNGPLNGHPPSILLYEAYANESSQICPFLALRPEFHSNLRQGLSLAMCPLARTHFLGGRASSGHNN